jgi:hypothetical protein
MLWAAFWAIFFTNSSGHPAHSGTRFRTCQFQIQTLKKIFFQGLHFFQFNDIHKQRILCKLLLKTALVRFFATSLCPGGYRAILE